jgi:putative ABC transport system permease protein
MKTLSLALRNLLRNRRRSITTLLAMLVGAQAILLFGGYSRDIARGLETDYVQRSGHLQIQHKDYFLYGTGDPAAYGIAHYRRVIEVLQHDPVTAPMLTVITPTLSLGGIAGNFTAGVSRTVIASGVVVDDLNRMQQWNPYEFPWPRHPSALTGTRPDAAVIGIGVARVLQLCGPLAVANCPQPPTAPAANGPALPADIAMLSAQEKLTASTGANARIELLGASARGAPNVVGLSVVKAENLGIKELDDIYIGLHLPLAQRLVYGGDAPQATAIMLQLQYTSQMPAAIARLQHLLATTFKDEALEIQDFGTLNPFFGQVIGMFDTIFSFISVLIGAIVLFTVGNTMSMAVVERTVEIGTLRALGLRRSGIRRLFVVEGLLIGIIGAVLGTFIAFSLAYLINHSGLTWLPPGQTTAIPLTVRVWGETDMIIGTAIGLAAVATLSAWWPARRAARLAIVDALRHV